MDDSQENGRPPAECTTAARLASRRIEAPAHHARETDINISNQEEKKTQFKQHGVNNAVPNLRVRAADELGAARVQRRIDRGAEIMQRQT